VVYPSDKAVFEQATGETILNNGPITVIGTNVTSFTSFGASLGEFYANQPTFAQLYVQNLNSNQNASTDIVAYSDIGDGTNNFVDMGICSSNYSEAAFPIFSPNVGYLYNDGGDLLVGSATDNVVIFAGGVNVNNTVAIFGTDLSTTLEGSLNVATTLNVSGAATFANTVTLNANPTTALQAATKQYVDNQVTAGLHIHEPVRVETTGNLNATYARAGATNINITGIANGTDVSFFGTVAVNDQVYTGTAVNGLLANTAYFIVNVLSPGVAQVSLTFGGAIVTGLTNGSFTQPAVINSGVGATLTNAGTQAALTIDSVALIVGNRVMVRLQTAGEENGVYTVTTVGDGSTNWVLTRATDANMVNPASTDGVGTGDYFFTREGALNAGDSHVLTTEPNTMILGYTPLTYTQFSGGVVYTGTAPINVTGQVISLTGTVAATNGGTGQNTTSVGDLLYGTSSNTWSKLALGAANRSLVVNGSGTQVEWNAVSLNAANAVSGVLPETNGGTNNSSYVLGDTLYSSAANTLAKLSGNTTATKKFLGQTGTGAVSAAPVWEQPAATDITGLATSATTDTTNADNITSGTLNNARTTATASNGASTIIARDINGSFSANSGGFVSVSGNGSALTSLNASSIASGTVPTAYLASGTANNTTFLRGDSTWAVAGGTPNDGTLTMNVSGVGLTGSASFTANQAGSSTFTVASNATSANGGSTIVARDASGNFAANTITAALSGNASTATNATNSTNAVQLTGVQQTNLVIGKFAATADINSANDTGSFSARGNASFPASMSFHREGVFAINMGLSTSNNFVIGGWSASANAFSMTGGGALTMLNNVTAFSDERVKTNWRDLQPDFIEQLAKVKHGIYDRTDQVSTQIGVGAQSLRPVMEHAVMEDAEGKLSVAYGNAALVAAIELAKQVVELKKEIELLKAK
jgi:hypothetical protein